MALNYEIYICIKKYFFSSIKILHIIIKATMSLIGIDVMYSVYPKI